MYTIEYADLAKQFNCGSLIFLWTNIEKLILTNENDLILTN